MRLRYLDSLRGIAALAVVWVHYFGGYGPGYFYPFFFTPFHIFWNGVAAISLFFVLSGFVLSYRSFNSSNERISVLPFYAARWLRITLPYVVVLLASWYCSEFLIRDFSTAINVGPSFANRWNLPQPDSWQEWLAEGLLMTRAQPFELVPQAWTLAFELQFALLFPFLVDIARSGRFRLAVFCVVAYVIFNVSIYIVHFALGIYLAKYFRRVPEYLSNAGRVRTLATVVLAVYCANYTIWPTSYKLDFGYDLDRAIVGLGTTLILLLVIGSARTRTTLLWSPLQLLGRVSYSLYLIHYLVLQQFIPPVFRQITAIGLPQPITHSVMWLIATTMCVLAAWCFYGLVEAPSHRLGRTVSRRLEQSFGNLERRTSS